MDEDSDDPLPRGQVNSNRVRMRAIRQHRERDITQQKDNHIRDCLRSYKISAKAFGPILLKIRRAYMNDELDDAGVLEICAVGAISLLVGLPIEMLKYRRMLHIAQNIEGETIEDSFELWKGVIRRYKEEILDRHRHEEIEARPDRPGEEPVDADQPPSVIVGRDQAERYNIRTMEPWLGPNPTYPMRYAPNSMAGETHIPFNDGWRPFPTYILSMSEMVRYNQPDRMVAFDRAAMMQQIPWSLPPHIQRSVKGELERMNTRIKPSAQYAMSQISRAASTSNTDIHLNHLIAALAFVHYDVQEKGRNAFLYRQLRSMGLKKCVDFEFPWRDRIRGTAVHNSRGQRLRINARDPPSRRNRNPIHFEETKNGKLLKQETLFKYKGLDEEGRMLYETLKDDLPGLEAQVRDMGRLRLNTLTIRDRLFNEGDEAWIRGDQSVVPGEISDDEGDPTFG